MQERGNMQYIYYLLFTMLAVFQLSNCSDLNIDDRQTRRREDRMGKVELPEEINDEDFFDFLNCKPSVNTPDNSMDVLTNMVIPNKNPLTIARKCLKDKLEKAHNKICDARYQLEQQREQARDNSTINRIENQIYRLDQIQWRFNQKLQELAQESESYRKKAVDKRNKATKHQWWLATLLWVGEQEAEAHSNIYDIESYNECFAPVNNDRRDRNRNNRDNRRNSRS